ncbi:hypothetical protein BT93_L4517 [Corymbia citriodora subsp. variegata]|uniref:Exonuclease domain-containing protein n=1 Tax=Corymbia citriodora subsp. variegata TaxID=360336 RepID=A0A8T0CFY9_CORYI|nr:hypothetical protein BT93_L4517 [Corymbia citriodora subsp. variegata]
MFSTVGLFKGIACPDGTGCTLLNCLFDHAVVADGKSSSTKAATRLQPRSISPPSKRRKLSTGTSVPNAVQTAALVSSTDRTLHTRGTFLPPEQPTAHTKSTSDALHDVANSSASLITKTKTTDNVESTTATLTSPVEPPVVSRRVASNISSRVPPAHQPELPKKPEILTPRTVTHQPVPFARRDKCLKVIHTTLTAANEKLAKSFPKKPEMRLSLQQLILQARNDEEFVAMNTTNPDAYTSGMAAKLAIYKGMTPIKWVVFIESNWHVSPPKSTNTIQKPRPSTGLTPRKEVAFLSHIRTPLAGLEQFGYTLTPPTQTQINEAVSTVKALANWEVCDRCSTRFQVYPGRNEQGELASSGICRYHWARSTFKKATAEDIYPCCGLPTHRDGCVAAKSHVFKTTDKGRLAAILQFATTPEQPDNKPRQPVAFDCEMVYTTMGMELCRVTAISWPDKKSLLDVLVRPYGEILDFNTRFSGITADLYNNAPNYDPSSSSDHGTLRKVSSPEAARRLMFDLLTPSTPLIGHAIDNDLNTCRMIHPFIIDTVILYPHPKGLPIRYKLRDLAARYLQRDIQISGAHGHDSLEDSEATGDLVLVKISEEWRNIRAEGWTWEGDVLTEPRAGRPGVPIEQI